MRNARGTTTLASSAEMPHATESLLPPGLDMAAIAELSDATMSRLEREELIEVIVAAAQEVRLATPPDPHRLQLRDTTTLRRLAHLARFACRNLIRCRSFDRQP
jgi:hypothetical protein